MLPDALVDRIGQLLVSFPGGKKLQLIKDQRPRDHYPILAGFWHAQVAMEQQPLHEQWDFDAMVTTLRGSSRAPFLADLE